MAVKARVLRYLGTNEREDPEVMSLLLGIALPDVKRALEELRSESLAEPIEGTRFWRIVLRRSETAYPTG